MPENVTKISGATEVDLYLGNYAYNDIVSNMDILRTKLDTSGTNRRFYKNAAGDLFKQMNDASGGTNHPTDRILFTDADGAADSSEDLMWDNTKLTVGGGIKISDLSTGIVQSDADGLLSSSTLLGIENLTDPGADRIMFWDNSINMCKWLTVQSPLQISGTTLSLNTSGLTTEAFKTIVSANQDVVANQVDDTLNLISGNNILTIAGVAASSSIYFTIVEGNIDHNALLNYSANRHIDHSLVSIDTGTGLDGGGDTTTTRTLSLSHLGIEDLTDPGADRIMFWDESQNSSKWLTVGSGLSISGTSLSCTISQYTDEQAQDAVGNILTNSTTIDLTYDDGANTITSNLSHLGIESLTDPGADRIMFWDDSETACKWLTVGTGLNITGSTITATATPISDHDALNNLTWSTSGHTIDATVDFVGNHIDNVGNLEVEDIYLLDSGNSPTLHLGDSFTAGNYGFIYWNSGTDCISIGTQAGGDNAIFDESGDSTFFGDVLIASNLIHYDDPNTMLTFGTDSITLEAGGVNAMVFESDKVYSDLDKFAFGKSSIEAWSLFSVLQIGGTGAVFSKNTETTGASIYIAQNLYYDGEWKKFVTDEATSYYQGNGYHRWYANDNSVAADTGFIPDKLMELDVSTGSLEVVDGDLKISSGNIYVTDSGGDPFIRLGDSTSLDFLFFRWDSTNDDAYIGIDNSDVISIDGTTGKQTLGLSSTSVEIENDLILSGLPTETTSWSGFTSIAVKDSDNKLYKMNVP